MKLISSTIWLAKKNILKRACRSSKTTKMYRGQELWKSVNHQRGHTQLIKSGENS
jgi:hypothetical protein